MNKVTIVVCWQSGTDEMVRACLQSIYRHTVEVDYEIRLVTIEPVGTYPFIGDFTNGWNINYEFLKFPPEEVSSRTHGKMLDQVIPDFLDSEYVLTLDSDAFPVADGWLSELIGMVEKGAGAAGILHPWSPPSPDLKKSKVEYRVRSQHCWETTHVACQLIRLEDYKELWKAGCRFNAGDDTGLLIPKMLKERGKKLDGFKPTRCPRVLEGTFDPEFNRYSCLVFGDKVYHHGGFSRKRLLSDDRPFDASFAWCEDLVLWGGGAEFLLNDKFSYKFKFDREEEVFAEKMQRLFGLKNQVMKG